MLTKKEIQKNREEIIDLLRSTKRKGIEDLVTWLDNSNFFTSPASTMFHGNYEGGLAAHSYECYKEFDRQIEHYEVDLPKESRIIASLGHDLCKVDYYIPNILKKGVSEAKPYKSNDEFPIGHGEKSVILVGRYIELTNKEALIMRWHMARDDPTWETYQDKVEKLCPEVVLFQHVDKIVSLIKGI